MPLPLFSPSAVIHPDTAKQDKIDLAIDLGCIRLEPFPGMGNDDALPFLMAVKTHFSGPASDQNRAELIRSSHHSRLFGRGREVLSVIVKERRDIGPGALFAGELRLSLMRTPHLQIQLDFQGYLNPTRYVRHQTVLSMAPGCRCLENAEAMRDSLFLRNLNADGKCQDEFSLDGNDNWLPQSARLESFSRGWNDRLREYVGAVRATLELEIQRVCERVNQSGNPVSWHPSVQAEWSQSDTHVQTVETYWEFKHSAPLHLVNSLEAELRAYCSSEVVTRDFRGREERDGRLLFGTEKNCRFVDAEVAPGIRLVIYAKTNARVRFEVRHGLRDLAHRRGLRQSCAGVSGACELVQSVSADAAGVLERFFAFLRSRVDFTPTSYSPLDLLFRCAECAERASYGDAVLRMLLAGGCVSRLPALTKTIRAMERAGIVERVENEQGMAGGAFVVTSPYRQALEVLRGLESQHPITGIVRRRRVRSQQR